MFQASDAMLTKASEQMRIIGRLSLLLKKFKPSQGYFKTLLRTIENFQLNLDVERDTVLFDLSQNEMSYLNNSKFCPCLIPENLCAVV